MIRRIGFRNTLRILSQRFLSSGKTRDDSYRVRVPGHPFPLYLRPYSSDPHVFWEVFGAHEYSCLDDVQDVRLIIDCGAYVGYSSLYFLHRYPKARLIAVEPDPGNFALLEKNLAPYADRVRLVRAGVWSHRAPMKISEAPYRDGREWAKQVRVCLPGEAPDFMAVDLSTLLAESELPAISILKIDVERAEVELFSHNYEGWIDKVDNLVVELHDEECRAAFYRATANRQLDVCETHFLGVCKRRKPTTSWSSEPGPAGVTGAAV